MHFRAVCEDIVLRNEGLFAQLAVRYAQGHSDGKENQISFELLGESNLLHFVTH